MNYDQVLQILGMVNNELQQISVKGIDTIHMANSLKGVSDVTRIVSDAKVNQDPEELTKDEEKEEDKNE